MVDKKQAKNYVPSRGHLADIPFRFRYVKNVVTRYRHIHIVGTNNSEKRGGTIATFIRKQLKSFMYVCSAWGGSEMIPGGT